MPSQTEIAKSLGVSKVYVHKLVKKGMPLTSFDEAKLWKNAHAAKRQTTSPVQLAKLLAEEADDDSPVSRERCKQSLRDKPNGAKLSSQNSLDECLESALQATREASRLLAESMIEGRDNKIGIRLSVHSKALEAYFKAEAAYRESLERSRTLISLAEAQDMARKGYDIILSRLAALPQNLAARCNPSDPNRAMEALEDECTAIIAEAQRAYAADASGVR
jgi:hypothetical protein